MRKTTEAEITEIARDYQEAIAIKQALEKKPRCRICGNEMEESTHDGFMRCETDDIEITKRLL